MASQQTQLQQYVNNSTNSDKVQFTKNQNMNQLSEFTSMKLVPQNLNLNKSHQFSTKEIEFNKLKINSSLNIPSLNIGTNISLNEQILNKNKDQSDYFNKDVLTKDEDKNDPIFEEYTLINNRRNQVFDNIKNINIRIKTNKLKLEKLKQNLNNLKKEKNQKQGDIINLLSNKESIEEIYKNQIYLLTNHLHSNINNNNNFDENITLNNDINNLTNINIKTDMNDNSAINLNSIHNITIDNEILNNDEDNFKISLNEIKESDQKIFIKQVIYLFEDIFKKRDDKINTSITSIIINSYELFINNNSGENDIETNDLVVNNFFGKMSLFISNHSLGKYSESKINLFLRYLMKINSIKVKNTKYLKFVNKKYKEKKKNLIDMINFLEKKNMNLTDKKHRLENNMKIYEDKLEFFGKNCDYEIGQNEKDVYLEQKNIGNDIYTYENKNSFLNFKTNSNSNSNSNIKKPKRIKNKKSNTVGALNIDQNMKKELEKLKKNKDEKLNYDTMIEYKDEIDQNDKINYEEDDSIKEYNYIKENEMINQRLNPYNNNNQNHKNINIKKNSIIYRQKYKINDKKHLFLDDDESDKYLSKILQNNTNKDPLGEKNNTINKRNSKNVIKSIPRNNNNQSLNYKSKTNSNFQMSKKINYNIFNNTSTNINSDKMAFPINQTQNIGNDLEDQISNIELEHYKRVQRIMNSNPNANNIFGVNNYNPSKDAFFSENKNQINISNSSNKIDKTIRYGSRKNHNFISIINMTKNAPINKKNGKENSKSKEKFRKIKDIDNDGALKIINLEDNFLNDISNDAIKNENEAENKINESTSMLTKSNNVESNTNSKLINLSHGSKNNEVNKSNITITNENIESRQNINIVSKINEKKKINNENNEIQGYFINIINSKEENKGKKNSSNNVINNKDKDNINPKIDIKDFFNNSSNIKTLKITKSKELNIKDIKNNKLSIITKKNITKALHTKKGDKPRTKLIQIRNRDVKKTESLNKTQFISKPNTSLIKTTLDSNITSSNLPFENKSANNSFINIDDTSINRVNGLKVYQSQGNFNTIDKNKQIKKEITKNKKSPNNMKKGKVLNIPISYNKINNNRNYNSNTYDRKFKAGFKTDKPKSNRK